MFCFPPVGLKTEMLSFYLLNLGVGLLAGKKERNKKDPADFPGISEGIWVCGDIHFLNIEKKFRVRIVFFRISVYLSEIVM